MRSANTSVGINSSIGGAPGRYGVKHDWEGDETVDDILDLATRLGKHIASDPRGHAMAQARDALEKSADDRQLLADYQSQQQKIHELEVGGKPIEADDKRRLADLHGKVISSQVIKDLLKAQTDYVELMTQVSSRIEHEALGGTGPAGENS